MSPSHGINSVAGDELRAIIERIESVEEQTRELNSDKKEIYQEAKSRGFDAKIIRKIVSMRRMDRDKREEEEAILELYMNALGMLADTPLGQAAIERARG